MLPTAAASPQLLCLQNPSFEGTPVANLGQPGAFDAMPWSTCLNASMSSNTSNMPTICDENVAQGVVMMPKATDGQTYLALGEGQQVSQAACSSIDSSAPLSLELDLSRVDIPQGIPEQVFLELWGGLAVDCSQRELLWASPALTVGWKHYCLTLHPHAFMDQLTLRSNSDMASAVVSYLIVDNLKAVETCP
jgi:hypothetical protein